MKFKLIFSDGSTMSFNSKREMFNFMHVEYENAKKITRSYWPNLNYASFWAGTKIEISQTITIGEPEFKEMFNNGT